MPLCLRVLPARTKPGSPRWLVLCLLVSSLSVHAEPDLALTVGQGWAVVSETLTVRLEGGEQELVLPDIPLGTRLSSITLRTKRVPIRLISWERPGSRSQPAVAGDTVIWRPHESAGHTEADTTASTDVNCRIASPVTGVRRVSVSYVVDGFTWSARYQLVVRGEVENEDKPVAVDLVGKAIIHNPARRAFEGAEIVLVGEGAQLARELKREAGFLDLDEGPLSALWNPRAPDPTPSYVYRLPNSASLWPHGESELPMVSAVRAPAGRIHVLRAEEFPLGVGPMRPLRKIIAFNNSGTKGLGMPLPPGVTQIYLGRKRDRLLQEGLLARTPAGEDIRIELGPSSLVTGRRRILGRTDAGDGSNEDVFELLVKNHHTGPVRVEVDEVPPVPLRWTVTRANARYELENQRLLFKIQLKPTAEKRFEYRVRTEQPLL